jgi:cysteine desulfurase / selenocysteine lyase
LRPGSREGPALYQGLNLVAQTYGRQNLKAGDEALISGLEHHSNIVPWQMLCDEKQARLRVVHIDDRGVIPLDQFEKALNARTRVVALSHVSNALGTVNPLSAMIEMAHRWNVPVVVDGAQAVPHMPVDVHALNADFYAFSGHKLFGPTGIGVLYGKQALLEAMPPFQGGGDMIRSVTFEKTEYNVLPYKFEAGTPDVAGIIGLGAAIDYVNTIGIGRIAAYESDLLEYGTAAFSEVRGIRMIGTAPSKASVISFVIDGVHPHDVGTILDQEGIAVRTGHHCAQPVMDRFQIAATTRASLAFYNTTAEIDALIAGIRKVQEFFS